MDDNYLDIPPGAMDQKATFELIKDLEKWNGYRKKYMEWHPNLKGVKLREANLEEANLYLASLEKAISIKANLKKANLIKANLEEADLSDVNLEGVWLHKANLKRASLTVANLEGAQLDRTNLEGADFTGANLTDVDIRKSFLAKINLSEANLSRAKLIETDLKGAKLSQANLQTADLTASNLEEADLYKVNLTDSKLNSVNLKNAKLWKTDLEGAILVKADLRGADLRGTKNVRFDQTLINGVLLSPNSDEPWTVLRREYTGSKLLFHLLLLIAFLIPLVTKTFLWNAVAQGEAFINNPTINELPERFVVSLLVGMPGDLKGWLSFQSLWFVVNLFIIAYNAARILLTVNVGHMREELESTGTSPKYHEDFPLKWFGPFRFMTVSIIIAFIGIACWLTIAPTIFFPSLGFFICMGIGYWSELQPCFKFIAKSESIDWLFSVHEKAQWLLLIGAGLAVINIIRWLFTTVHAPL